MGFLLSLKQNSPRNKSLATFLLNIFQIELILSLVITFKAALYEDAFQFIFHTAQTKTELINLALLVMNIMILGLTVQQGNSNNKSNFYSKMIHTFTIKFVKKFPYIGFIPMIVYSLTTIRDQQVQYKIIAGLNIIFSIAFYQLNQISNWAYRFIQVDYCNQRNSNQFSIVLIIVYLIVSGLFSPLYASFIYLVRGLFKIMIIFQHYDYPLIQKVDLFYGLFTIYLFLVAFGTSFFAINLMESFREFTLLSIFALFVCYISVNPIILRLNYERIKNSPQITLMDKDQRESLPQNIHKTIEQAQNVLRILTHVFLEKQKMQESQQNQYSKWWQIFNRVVMIHRIQCQKSKCICTTIKKNPKAESMIYIIELLKISENLYLLNTKMFNVKIMSIYLFIEIAKKPLKAYYEIMRLKQEKINSDTDLELEYLIKETRECFDQVFLKNKAKNQQLELSKVIQYEELMINLNKNLDEIIQKVINFNELFLYSTIKTSSIKTESNQIFQKKTLLQNQVYNIIVNYSENTRLNLIIFVFYRYLEVYKSNESELKKLSSQLMLKKRIYQKKEANIFSPEFGSIYIDLVQERGKILNLTSNMCEAFGYNREQMIDFNIRRYMPTIFARHHDRFLSNFVEKGKIKLLKQKERVIFAKNKKKFIFPINARLKAEYLLQNQFGSSSLINAVETNSEFMMVGSNGKLQELSENLYKKIFGTVFREEVTKCNRLSAFKLLPSLNRIHDPSEQKSLRNNRIYEGVLLYSLSQELFNQKFRYARELSMSGGTTAGTSRTGSQSQSQSGARMSIMSAATNNSNNGMPQNEIIDFLTETFKAFLIDVNIFKLKGYKVSYKLSQIHTSEFMLTLIEFITFEPLEGVPFYNAVLSELRNVSQIYQLNQEHGPIAVHLNEVEEVIKENKYHQYALDPVPQHDKKVDFTNVGEYEGQVERKRESYARNGTLYNKHFDELRKENGSDNSLMNEEANKNQAFQEYERSEQSSMLENTQSESKKQILINAFNSKKSAVSKNALWAMNFLILGLIILLILLSVFSISFVYENQFLWKDVSFILTTNQAIGFKIALTETEIFQKKMSTQVSPFISQKKSTSITKMKQNLQKINNNTIDSSLTDNFYTQKIQMFNAETNKSSQVTLAQFLNRYLYMLMYESDKNIEELRNNYGQMVLIFNQLERQKFSKIQDIQTYNYKRIIIILSLYVFFLLLTNALIIPIYTYYKNQENNVIGLLSYMNIREIRKSITKLKQVKELLKSRENNLNHFFALAGQNSNERKHDKQKISDMEAKGTNKALKISSEHDGSSIKVTNIICMLLGLVIFMSNFAVASFYITFTAQKHFRNNLKSAELAFKFQNKSPLIVNTLLSNVDRYINNKQKITYPDQVYNEGGEGFFAPVEEMSKTQYKESKISELTKEMFSSKLCKQVIQCNIEGTYKKSMTLSFEYLVYSFKEKFAILLPEGKYSLTNASIKEWIEENKIEDYVLWLEEIITMTKSINTKMDIIFQEDEKDLRLKLLICALILIPINIILIIYAQIRFLRFLNEMLMESEKIFRHFNVSVLIENTYLTSYFNSKIKQNK